MKKRILSTLGLAAVAAALNANIARAADALPSWQDGAAKKAIVEFVAKVTKEGGPDFVSPAERIAVFDNDGTLWAEQPMYFQLAFALDRVKALAPQHPEWQEKEPYKSALKSDLKGVLAGGEHALLELLAGTHTGMTTEEFEQIVKDWLATAKHPKTERLYTEMVYQPMLELLAYLRANGFKTYIVSGGGVEFMRVWSEEVYGIPPEQVVGSSGKQKFEMRDGRPVLVKVAELDHWDDKEGKPLAIQRFIGRRPIAASHRCRARMGLRPQVLHRSIRQGARRSQGQRLERRQHEGRLEAHLPVREQMRAILTTSWRPGGLWW